MSWITHYSTADTRAWQSYVRTAAPSGITSKPGSSAMIYSEAVATSYKSTYHIQLIQDWQHITIILLSASMPSIFARANLTASWLLCFRTILWCFYTSFYLPQCSLELVCFVSGVHSICLHYWLLGADLRGAPVANLKAKWTSFACICKRTNCTSVRALPQSVIFTLVVCCGL